MNDGTGLNKSTATRVYPVAIDERPGGRFNLWAHLLGGFLSRSIKSGTLILTFPDGSRQRFGSGGPQVAATITRVQTLRRIALNPDLAVGEAFMDGSLRIDSGDIYEFLDLVMGNLGMTTKSPLRRGWLAFRRLIRPLTLFNPASRSRANVAHHYDLTDRLYDLFLDADRQYSCAYFGTPVDTLEQAQDRKKRHIAAKLLLRPGQKVLDIGSGWGGLARFLAVEADVSVTGLTLSEEQLSKAKAQTAGAGLKNKVAFHLRDYRHETGRYDRIVSVGMFEHVGTPHYRTYFDSVAERLTEDGVALIHTIGSSSPPGAPGAWIKKYIFPGGYVPAMSEVLPAIEKSGLIVTDVEVLRLHYAETLRIWRQRFLANRARIAELYDDRFCRMWEFYLAACEAGFRHGGLVVFQFQLAKRNSSVPLTRDYIAKAEGRGPY
jgi:cyclopropane-fatty-acyl-phospholipid synthase